VNEGQFTALPLKALVLSTSPNSWLPRVKFRVTQNRYKACCPSSGPSPAFCASFCRDRVELGGSKPSNGGPVLAGVFLAALTRGCNSSPLLNPCLVTELGPKRGNLSPSLARSCPGGFPAQSPPQRPCSRSDTSHGLPAPPPFCFRTNRPAPTDLHRLAQHPPAAGVREPHGSEGEVPLGHSWLDPGAGAVMGTQRDKDAARSSPRPAH